MFLLASTGYAGGSGNESKGRTLALLVFVGRGVGWKPQLEKEQYLPLVAVGEKILLEERLAPFCIAELPR